MRPPAPRQSPSPRLDLERRDLGRLSPRVRAGLILTLSFWGSNYFLLTLGTALAGNPRLEAIALVRILTTLLGLVFCFLIHRLLVHPSLGTTKRRIVALIIAAPIAAECFAWAAYFAEAAVDPAVSARPFTWPGAIRSVSFWTWFFLAWAGLYMMLMYSFDVQEERDRAAQLRDEIHEAQLRALHSQINPHFLFNSLNSVSALILDDRSVLAEHMITKLAQFLRLALAADPKTKIPLWREMDLQRAYLEIEQLRFPDMMLTISLPDDLQGALVPALILQPIVENAVKYGVSGAPPPAAVSIAASSSGSRLALIVTDRGRGGSAEPGAGIGLRNIEQRLDLIYGPERVTLEAGPVETGGFQVRVAIPLER